MRLMLLTADYPSESWSGLGVAVERQAGALSKLGAEVHVLYAPPGSHPPARTASSCEASGVFFHDLRQERFPVNTRGFDWIHLHSLALAELAFELRRRTGIPLAYTAHSVIARELAGVPEAGFWSALQRQVMQSSDAVVFLSESERETALEFAPQVGAHAFVVGNAVPLPVSVPPVDREGFVMFAGRFAMSKGIPLLVELMPELCHWKNIRCVLAGGHGDSRAERLVLEMSEKLGDRCQLLGWVEPERLESLFGQAAVVLVPSYYEPFGLVALEAMRMGAPVVAARGGGLAETVSPGSGGCLVSSHNAHAWLEQILEIMENPGLRTRLSQQGPGYVAAKFNPTRIAARLMEKVYVH
jgi:glycosyltransferase involved in cell wall biosynthesis